MLGAVHTLLGGLSLILGAQIFLSTKGTRWHIQLGWAYVGSMFCVNVTALFIYRLTGAFNLFHAMAVFSLLMVVAGVFQVRFRSRLRRWLWRHYQYMSWSYVGLLAATANEAFVRIGILKTMAATSTTAMPLIASILIVAVSGAIIFSRQRSLLARYGQVDRPGTDGP
jgi:uncharacterized membrane protein